MNLENVKNSTNITYFYDKNNVSNETVHNTKEKIKKGSRKLLAKNYTE